MNSREAFWKLSRGRIFVRTVLIPEGWTIYDIAAEIERAEDLQPPGIHRGGAQYVPDIRP